MEIKTMTDLQKLSLDAYSKNVKNFSVGEAEDAIRNALLEACGGEWNMYRFMDNKGKVFEVVSEVLSIGLGTVLEDQFNQFADFKDVALGDKASFDVEDNSLFTVATIANGNTDITRQKIYGSSFTVATKKLAVKIYTELDMFMSGRYDWTKAVDRVKKSFVNQIGTRIYDAIYGAYGSLVSPYATSGAMSDSALAEMIAHVEAKSGQKAVVYGTKVALGKISNSNLSDSMKDELHALGYLGRFQGTPLYELPQAHKAGTDTFAVADDFLLVVPSGDEKIIKVVLEGDTYVYDTPAGVRNDEQIEFFFGRKVGVAAVTAKVFAIYKISA